MSQRWRMTVELTWERQEGDTSFYDVATIASLNTNAGRGTGKELDRAKNKLNEILDGKPILHYHVLELPHSCWEDD